MIGEVVGYSYQAENLCPSHTIAAMRGNGIKVASGRYHEDAIRRAAEKIGVDFDDERSYDSDDFPKAIAEGQACTEITERPDTNRSVMINDERCCHVGCGKWLVEGEKSPSERTMAKIIAEKYDLPRALANGVQEELRRWGYTHPEHIDEDDVQLAARRTLHDYVTVTHPHGLPIEQSTPEYDGDDCIHCDGAFEDHKVTCTTCKEVVGAADVHRHPIQVQGQRPLPMRKARS